MLPPEDTQYLREEAQRENDFNATKQEWQFKLHELQQRHVLMQLQTVNFALLSVLLICLLLYYRPQGVKEYLMNWTWPFRGSSSNSSVVTAATPPPPPAAAAAVAAPKVALRSRR